MMLNKKIYIHVGPPKTGTSAIQRFMNDNRESLLRDGVFYPAHEVDSNGISSGNLLSIFDREPNKELVLSHSKLNSLLTDFKSSSADVLLLSSEYFFKNIEIINSLIPDAIFIAYVRNPISNIESAYNQSVKRHSYVKKINPVKNINVYTLTLLERAVKKIGRERFILRAYDTKLFDGENIVSDFLSILNVKIETPKDNKFTNRSYSFEALEFKRWLNKFELEEITNVLDQLLQSFDGGNLDFSLLTPDQFEIYKEQSIQCLINFHSKYDVFNGNNLIENIRKELPKPYVKQDLSDEEFLSVANYIRSESEFLYIRICQLLYKHSYLPIYESRFVDLFVRELPKEVIGWSKTWRKILTANISWSLKRKYIIDYIKYKIVGRPKQPRSPGTLSVKGLNELKNKLDMPDSVSNYALLIQLAQFCEENRHFKFAYYLTSEAETLSPSNPYVTGQLAKYELLISESESSDAN